MTGLLPIPAPITCFIGADAIANHLKDQTRWAEKITMPSPDLFGFGALATSEDCKGNFFGLFE